MGGRRRVFMTVIVAVMLGFVPSSGQSDQFYDAASAVWPRPLSTEYPEGDWFWRLHLQSLQVVFDKRGPHWDAVHEILAQAANRYSAVTPIAASAKQEKEGAPGRVIGITSQITVLISNHSTSLNLATPENYVLDITRSNGITISAHTVFGVLRGLETFSQLVEPRTGSKIREILGDGRFQDKVEATRFYVPCVKIADAPAFPYRGVMIDTSRHFLPMKTIESVLDAMEANKMNILHWHVSDDQSFPFASQSNPKLSQAAYSPQCVYTHADVRRISQLALFRGIRIIPEFDTPGHSASFGVGYPEVLAVCPHISTPDHYMINPTKPATLDLVTSLLEEAARTFGATDLIHLGGDEVDPRCLEDSSEVQEYMERHSITDAMGLLADYQKFLDDLVTSRLHMTGIVWQEVFDSDLPMHPDTIVDVWQNQDDVARVVTNARRVVLSSCWYLDHLGTDWRSMYYCDPLDFPGSEQGKDLVLGGHSSMWGEHVDETNALSRIWPRSSAVAERLWSSPDYTNAKQAHGDLEDRLHLQRCRLVARGIDASPIRPGLCSFQ